MTTLLDRARSGESLADLDITDMHGHLGRWHFAIPDLSPSGLVAAMDRIGVSRILVSHTACISGDVSRGNDVVAAALREHPGRIEGYVALFPANGDFSAAETARCLDAGFIGVKLHNSNGFPYTDPAYAPALALANERRLPVLLHTWGKAEEFRAVRTLTDRYADIVWLLAHSGCTSADEYGRIARECPNVYLDLAYSAAPRGLVGELVASAGAEKVVWGSDAIFLCMSQQIGRVLGADISDDAKLKILSGNARGVLDRVRR